MFLMRKLKSSLFGLKGSYYEVHSEMQIIELEMRFAQESDVGQSLLSRRGLSAEKSFSSHKCRWRFSSGEAKGLKLQRLHTELLALECFIQTSHITESC